METRPVPPAAGRKGVAPLKADLHPNCHRPAKYGIFQSLLKRGLWEDRVMSELHRITTDPNQCGGRPCVRGLRVRVKDILDLLAAGTSRENILKDYPYLEDGDITAALEYAARQADHTVLNVA